MSKADKGQTTYVCTQGCMILVKKRKERWRNVGELTVIAEAGRGDPGSLLGGLTSALLGASPLERNAYCFYLI